MSARDSARPTPEQFLADYPAAIGALAEQLRAIVRDTMPNAVEAVYPGWKLIGYRVPDGGKTRYFCYVAPLADRVSLGFEYGVLMANDAGLLEGTGSQVRYVAFRPGDTPDPAALAPLIAEAAAIASTVRRKK